MAAELAPTPLARVSVGASWPKNATILGRAALAITLKLGALDFATEERASLHTISDRHYHHIFPDALLREAGISNSFIAMNCALINDKTNLNIGRKEPLSYLKERYEWADQDVVKYRLSSHLIPLEELANGGYEELSDSERHVKVRKDYSAFIQKRGVLFEAAAKKLCQGHPITANEIVEYVAISNVPQAGIAR